MTTHAPDTAANPVPAAGWYPDSAEPGVERWYDGAAWTPATRAAGTPAAPGTPDATAGPVKKKKGKKGKVIAGSILAGVIAIAGISAISGGGDDSAEKDSASISQVAEDAAAGEAAPAEEAPAAPAAELGTVENPHPSPYTQEGMFGGEKYSVSATVVDANGNAAVQEYNPYNEDAPAGYKYVLVSVAMTGIDPEGVEPSTEAYSLHLATAEGNAYDNEMFMVYPDGVASISDGPTLYPGQSFTGMMAFIVPEGAQSFFLQVDGQFVQLNV